MRQVLATSRRDSRNQCATISGCSLDLNGVVVQEQMQKKMSSGVKHLWLSQLSTFARLLVLYVSDLRQDNHFQEQSILGL